jgi:hypothetical protein
MKKNQKYEDTNVTVENRFSLKNIILNMATNIRSSKARYNTSFLSCPITLASNAIAPWIGVVKDAHHTVVELLFYVTLLQQL